MFENKNSQNYLNKNDFEFLKLIIGLTSCFPISQIVMKIIIPFSLNIKSYELNGFIISLIFC